jgi:hypothetical protein
LRRRGRFRRLLTRGHAAARVVISCRSWPSRCFAQSLYSSTAVIISIFSSSSVPPSLPSVRRTNSSCPPRHRPIAHPHSWIASLRTSLNHPIHLWTPELASASFPSWRSRHGRHVSPRRGRLNSLQFLPLHFVFHVSLDDVKLANLLVLSLPYRNLGNAILAAMSAPPPSP